MYRIQHHVMSSIRMHRICSVFLLIIWNYQQLNVFPFEFFFDWVMNIEVIEKEIRIIE